jgi:hypothetical protein
MGSLIGRPEGEGEEKYEHDDEDKDAHEHEQAYGDKLMSEGAKQTRVWGWWQLPRSGWCLTMHAALPVSRRIRGSVWGRRG